MHNKKEPKQECKKCAALHLADNLSLNYEWLDYGPEIKESLAELLRIYVQSENVTIDSAETREKHSYAIFRLNQVVDDLIDYENKKAEAESTCQLISI